MNKKKRRERKKNEQISKKLNNLNNKVAHHSTIVRVHPRAIGVKDSSNADVNLNK